MGMLSCGLASFAGMLALVGVPIKAAGGWGMTVLLMVIVAAVVGMCAVGIGLGFIGLMSKRRKKALSAAGLVANPVVLGILALFLWWPSASTLVTAASMGDLGAVRSALRMGVPVDAMARIPRGGQYRELTALTIAADRGWVDVVAALVAHEADLQQTDGEGRTAMDRAAAAGHLEVVKLLLAEGASPEGSGSAPTPLSTAARAGYLPVVQVLVERGADMTPSGALPLANAAAGGHTRTVEYLVGRGVDVNAADAEGNTAMHLAAKNGHFYSVSRLLRFKADPNLANAHGETPLEIAVQNNRRDIVRLLIEAGSSIDAFTTIGLGDLESLKQLVARNPDAVRATKRGRTPLHVACELGKLEAVKVLLEAGAPVEPEREDETVRTPLATAIKHNQPEIVGVLLEHGADANVTIRDTGTAAPPLYYAVVAGQYEAAKMLLASGAEINAHCVTTGVDATPLYYAIHYGKDDIARLLIESHADVNTRKNPETPTPLYEAIMRGNLEMVKLLLKHQADPNAKVVGMSPLALARDRRPHSPFIYNQIVFIIQHYGGKE